MKRTIAAGMTSAAFAVLASYAAMLANAADEAGAGPSAAPVEVQVFKGPSIKSVTRPPYPESERQRGNEGWVRVNFMIDPEGKPYEITVVDSIGADAFEKNAVQAVEKTVFQPAMLGTTPVHSALVMKFRFFQNNEAKGARRPFITAYRQLIQAIDAGDRAGADAQMAKLEAENLYEDAHFNMALFKYHHKWGTEQEQLRYLRAAVAGEDLARYLPRDVFRAAAQAMLTLEITQQDYAAALDTWEVLKKTTPKKDLKDWEPIIEQVEAQRKADRPIRLSGVIAKHASWTGGLFRNRFEVAVASGAVSEIKLRCDKKFVFFRYEPNVRYTVEDSYGRCTIQLVGDPGTKFDLVQS